MSYYKIFQQKIIRLSDERLIVLRRGGCNNDNSGRDKAEFVAIPYTQKNYDDMVKAYKDSVYDGSSDEYICMVYGKWKTNLEYGLFMERALKRTISVEKLLEDYKPREIVGVTETKVDERTTRYTYHWASIDNLEDEFNRLFDAGIEYKDIWLYRR